MIDHDFRQAAGTQHPMDLGDGRGSIGAVMDDTPGIHHVEGRICKRQAFGIPDEQQRVQSGQGETALGVVDGAPAQIDAAQARARCRETLVIGAKAHADL